MWHTKLLRSSVIASVAMLAACAGEPSEETADDDGASTSDITNIEQSDVKRQSIGNCWLYAVHSWAEGLNKRATGTALNLSESYLTYWHWFEQIANGGAGQEIRTGGSYSVGVSLIGRYGMIAEGDFLPQEADAEMSGVQKRALDAMNLSLKSGVLKDPAKRRDRKVVREELDKAFALSPEVRAKLDAVFGANVSKTLDRSFATRAPGKGILRSKDIPVKLPDPETKQLVDVTLADAIGEGTWSRRGKYAFHTESYPRDERGRRDFQIRMQKALHDGVTMVVTWDVDFNALTSDSKFSKAQLDQRGPGRQGGHMTVLSDYQVKLADGRVLEVGKTYAASDMKAALNPGAKVEMFRVKNSWGGLRPDRWSVGNGYHDLLIDYLNGPVKKCVQVNDTSDPNQCNDSQPLRQVELPAGY
jgi:hypothetical protein